MAAAQHGGEDVEADELLYGQWAYEGDELREVRRAPATAQPTYHTQRARSPPGRCAEPNPRQKPASV